MRRSTIERHAQKVIERIDSMDAPPTLSRVWIMCARQCDQIPGVRRHPAVREVYDEVFRHYSGKRPLDTHRHTGRNIA